MNFTLGPHLSALEATGLIRPAPFTVELEYLFRHALIQETAYATLVRQDRYNLHRGVAEALERLHPGRESEVAATLAHHFERAEAPDRAAHYLRLAGDRARRVYANQEAIGFYEAALRLLPACFEPAQTTSEAALRESLGDVLALVGRPADARTHFTAAEAALPESETIERARLLRKAGAAWDDLREVDQAMQAFAAAERALGPEPAAEAGDWHREWTHIQTDKMGVLYWLGDWQAIAALAEQARPVLDRFGTPELRAQFLDRYVGISVQRDRYRFSDEVMALCRDMLAAAEESGDLPQIVNAEFSLGFGHLWRRELAEAEARLQKALRLSEQIGSTRYRVWSLSYLGVVNRFRGRPAEVRQFSAQIVQVANAGDPGPLLPWLALAAANRAWAAWREGDAAETLRLGREADGILQTLRLPFPLRWLGAWPLAGAALESGAVAEAAEQARRMLEASQQRQPNGLEALLQAGVAAWQAGQAGAAGDHLLAAAAQARALGYL